MAAVAIDSLEYAHQLEAVGMPREQAEAVAKGLTTMFIHNFDSLVTKDYLDTRFTEFETRITANMDRRFGEVNGRFVHMETSVEKRFVELGTSMDTRFVEMGSNMDTRFVEMETSMDTRFVEMGSNMDTRFVEMETNMDTRFANFRLEMQSDIGKVRGEVGALRGKLNLHAWMLAMLMGGVFGPILQNMYS
jgi:hypothetical protein